MLQSAAVAQDSQAMLEAGAAILRSGGEEEAIGPVAKQLERDPANAQLWLLLALLQRQAEDMPAAVAAADKAIALNATDPIVVSTHAFVIFEAGLPATELFDRAIALQPTHSLVLGRAASQVAAGELSAAIETLDQHLRPNPLWLQGHGRLSNLRWAAGDGTFARSFEQALAQVPRNAELWRDYVTTFNNAGRYADAIALVERGKAAIGEHPSLVAAEAIARSSLGDLDAAERLFMRLPAVQEVGLTEHLVRHLLRSQRASEAARLAEAWLPYDAEHRLWPYLSLAWRLIGDKRWDGLEGNSNFIGVYDIREHLPPLDRLAATLRRLHGDGREPLALSVRGGTQTEGHLLQRIDADIQQMRAAIVGAVERHAAQLPDAVPGHPLLGAARSPIRFSGAWSVRLTGGGHHANHTHPQGWLSSALYIALPEETQQDADESGWLALGENPEFAPGLPPIRTIQPKPGQLVLFPSTMWHGTRSFGSGERLTVAFDVKRPA